MRKRTLTTLSSVLRTTESQQLHRRSIPNDRARHISPRKRLGSTRFLGASENEIAPVNCFFGSKFTIEVAATRLISVAPKQHADADKKKKTNQ
jgi:hypothetical protein